MTASGPLIASLRRASTRALREADTWIDLADYVDELHAEQERFLRLINERKIGAHVARSMRPQELPRADAPERRQG